VNKEIKMKLQKVRCLILDVDGVLTDGGIIIDDNGQELKKFDVRDGHGLKLVMRCDISVVILTGRQSQVVSHRAKELGITAIYQKATNKIKTLDEIMEKYCWDAETIAYIGDDIVDVPVLRRVGFGVAVADASIHAKKASCYVTDSPGGKGAVREVCEMILQAQGRWDEIVEKYNLIG